MIPKDAASGGAEHQRWTIEAIRNFGAGLGARIPSALLSRHRPRRHGARIGSGSKRAARMSKHSRSQWGQIPSMFTLATGASLNSPLGNPGKRGKQSTTSRGWFLR